MKYSLFVASRVKIGEVTGDLPHVMLCVVESSSGRQIGEVIYISGDRIGVKLGGDLVFGRILPEQFQSADAWISFGSE